MSFFWPRFHREYYSLVFNITSGSVAGTIVKFTEKTGVEVVYYSQEPIAFQKDFSATRHLELLKKSIISLVSRLHDHGSYKIQNIFYIFSSPWIISQTKVIKIKETKPIRLTEAYFKKLIADQEKIAKKEAERNPLVSDISAHGEIIEKKIVELKINGYSVSDLDNRQAKDAEVSIFMSVVPDKILNAVEEAVAHSYMVKNIYCHSSALALFSTVRDLFPNQQDFVSVSFGEEITEVSIVKSGVVLAEASFPIGRNSFVRELARQSKVSEAVADSMIKMNAQKSHNELASLRFATNINSIAGEWYAQFDLILKKFMESFYIPHEIFFVSSHDLAGLLVGKLKDTGFAITPLIARKISSPVKIDDIMFKISLMFLDKLYKI